MANIYYFDSLNATTGVLAGSGSAITSSDGYLHIYNYGQGDLLANLTSSSSPTAPTAGIPVKAGEWTLLPADTADGAERIVFACASQGQPDGPPYPVSLHIWTT